MRTLQTLLLVAAGAAAAAPAVAWAADNFPVRPLRLIVPVPPGGAADFTARIVAAKLAEALGQPMVVENRGGASGAIASQFVAQSTADGYTMLLSSSTTHGIAPALFTKLPYDPMKSFTHIALINSVPGVMVVHVSVPATTVKEFVALAKAKPTSFHFGSSGSGSPPHMMGELFKLQTGAPIIHVPYKGSGPASVDLASGQLQAMLDGLPSLIGNIKAGRVRPLAALSARRSTVLPDVPTMAEAGYPGVEGGLWFGLSGPAGIPAAATERISREVARLVALDDVKERFASVGSTGTPLGPAEYTEFIRKDIARWVPVVKSANITVD